MQATGEGTCRGVAFARRGTQAVRIRGADAVVVRGVLRGRDGKPLQDVPVRARTPTGACSTTLDDADGRRGAFSAVARCRSGRRFRPRGSTVRSRRGRTTPRAMRGRAEAGLEPATDLRVELAGLPAEKPLDREGAAAAIRERAACAGCLRRSTPCGSPSGVGAEGACRTTSIASSVSPTLRRRPSPPDRREREERPRAEVQRQRPSPPTSNGVHRCRIRTASQRPASRS